VQEVRAHAEDSAASDSAEDQGEAAHHQQRALRRAEVLEAIKSASKRKPSGIAPDSCGKPGAPHDLEGGALVSRKSFISKKRRRALDEVLALSEAGTSAEHAEIVD
jgi:hypothetical protein